MSQATLSQSSVTAALGWHDFFLRRLHSLTGIVFGGYLVVHLLVNATLVQGTQPDIYQAQVDKIHQLPFLWALEWFLIYLPILFHAVYGTWITFTGRPNIDRYPYPKNYFYVLQRISAIIIAVFILFHILAMKGLFGSTLAFHPEAATITTARHINASFFLKYLVYPIGITASCFHLANGFWTAAITWGLTVSAGSQRRWGIVCGVLFVFTLACGFLALGAAIHDGSMLPR